MKFKGAVFFLILFIKTINTNGQIDTVLQTQKSIRPFYVANLTHQINITPFVQLASNKFTFNGNKNKLEYSPNEGPSFGLHLQHKWIGFSLTYGPPNLQEKKKGTSNYTSVILNSYGKKIGFDVYYLDYRGYYVSNNEGIHASNPNRNANDPFPQRNDLHTNTIGTNVYYILNFKKYSYRSTFVHNEIQKRSAGSIIINGSVSYYSIQSDSSLIPRFSTEFFQDVSKLANGQFLSVGILPGYSYTLVLKQRLFLTLSISIGAMYQFQSFNVYSGNELNNKTNNLFLPRAMGRAGFGYNSDFFYTGISTVADNYNIKLANGNSLQYMIGNAQLYFGFRLKVPEKIKEYSSYLDKVPIISGKPD